MILSECNTAVVTHMYMLCPFLETDRAAELSDLVIILSLSPMRSSGVFDASMRPCSFDVSGQALLHIKKKSKYENLHKRKESRSYDHPFVITEEPNYTKIQSQKIDITVQYSSSRPWSPRLHIAGM